MAPHPFFPIGASLRDKMHAYARLFDAVEYNAMFTTALNFNRRALRWARWHGKPLVETATSIGFAARLHLLAGRR